MAFKDAIATVLNRNAFYRDGYRLLLRISLIQTGVIALLVAGIIGLVITIHPQQIYFATTSDGRIINIVPLNEPYRSQADVVTWAAAAAQNIMRFDYADFHARLQQSESLFTPTGWNSFNKALKESSILDAVQARKLVVTLAIGAAPEIISEGARNGVYTWDLRFPVTIKFDGAEAPQPISATLLMRIVRVSTLQNPDGISIEQWVVASAVQR